MTESKIALETIIPNPEDAHGATVTAVYPEAPAPLDDGRAGGGIRRILSNSPSPISSS